MILDRMVNLRRYYVRFLLFSLAVFLAALLFYVLAKPYASRVFLWYVPFFMGSGFASMYLIHLGLRKPDPGFTQVFLGVTMLRFFLYLALLVAYSLVFREDAIRFILGFLAFYFLFTFFEVGMLFRSVRKGN